MELTLKSALKSMRAHESKITTLLGVMVIVVIGLMLIRGNREVEGELGEASTTSNNTIGVSAAEQTQQPATHTVQAGEHLWSISQQYYGNGHYWQDIAEVNGLRIANALAVGQVLSLPKNPPQRDETGARIDEFKPVSQAVTVTAKVVGEDYVVVAGDSLWGIAATTYGDGHQWPALYDANSDVLVSADELPVGISLRIPKL